nr:uncharacterized protein LOC127340759 [Lolium perenne]
MRLDLLFNLVQAIKPGCAISPPMTFSPRHGHRRKTSIPAAPFLPRPNRAHLRVSGALRRLLSGAPCARSHPLLVRADEAHLLQPRPLPGAARVARARPRRAAGGHCAPPSNTSRAVQPRFASVALTWIWDPPVSHSG